MELSRDHHLPALDETPSRSRTIWAHTAFAGSDTVEGLSVAAIAHYIVGLISYMAKGMQSWGWPQSAETTTAISIPFVALGVWWLIRRLHQRCLAHQHESRVPRA